MIRFRNSFLKMKLKNSNRGYTLVELITAMAILALLGGSLYTLFFSGSKTYAVAHDSYLAQNSARTAMSYITVKIRQNDAVISSAPGIVSSNISVSGSALAIKTPSSPDLQIYSEDGKLMEKTGDDDAVMITDGIDNVRFTTSASSIGISVIYEGGKKSLDETVTLRAEP